MNLSCCKFALPLLLLLSMPVHHVSAQWQRYDETADLAQLAEHENARMHFQLLNSKLLDKNDLWQAFIAELSQFTASDYEALKPLILEQSISALQLAVAEGSLSYEAIVTFYIYRIREIESDDNRYINAVISLNPEAIARARMLDESRSGDTNVDSDSIFGMPVLLKDNIGFDGLPTTAGAVALRENMTANAFITDRLEEEGAIVLGKANLSEWAYFFCNDCPSGYSALGGQTLNPYGRFQFGTGGSSSGSAAATAANYAVVAVGSETSGSILSPASANSLVGLKPTTGNLSRTGIVPISATLDTAGPIARSVADAVVMFNAMAGYDRNDMAMPLISDDFSLEYRVIDLPGKRLGIVEALADNSHYMAAVHLLAGSGATTIELEFSPGRDDRFSQLLGGEMVRDLALYLDRFASSAVEITSISALQAFNEGNMGLRAPYGQGLVSMMSELNLSVAELELIREELQSAARAQLDKLFNDSYLDVLLSVNNRYASIAALANYPALTIPMGYEADGRPIGLTLFAPPYREQDLIDVGANYEQLSKARKTPSNY